MYWRTHACVLTVSYQGGLGPMPSVTVTCVIVTNRGVGRKNTHVTRDIFYGRSLREHPQIT